MKKELRFLEAVDTLLAQCPRCGGDGMHKTVDAPSSSDMDDVFFDYEDCAICSDIRDAVRTAQLLTE